MVEIIEPFGSAVFDPACGSDGMFVQSAKFIDRHRDELVNGDGGHIYVYGHEKTLETVKLAKMNLAVNGLRGDVRQATTYYENLHDSFGRFDYMLANPPFNVDEVSLSGVEKDRCFNTYGISSTRPGRTTTSCSSTPATLAEYEDVTGLCKLAKQEEVEEQDYSLNPGRYVGVVIEADGKREGECIEELLVMYGELSGLNDEAQELEAILTLPRLKRWDSQANSGNPPSLAPARPARPRRTRFRAAFSSPRSMTRPQEGQR